MAVEMLHQGILANVWSKIANEDRVFRTTVVAAVVSIQVSAGSGGYRLRIVVNGHPLSVGKSSTRSPIELERTGRIWDWLTVAQQRIRSSFRAGKVDEAISSITAMRITSQQSASAHAFTVV